ncbi:hypothetical protein K470DRAFT_142917 [Piedraia hortae CBS 480.64]|uniref:Uncharacterized protein n=1 Tax=Piedraia hortae CBS 480.64 TaxID=1314780 RepID=A0A6A7C723_9PEZI|nr:hypothetical protein K470DRAFT_142917 [Piedraia hortae CBS 480.64]
MSLMTRSKGIILDILVKLFEANPKPMMEAVGLPQSSEDSSSKTILPEPPSCKKSGSFVPLTMSRQSACVAFFKARQAQPS